MERLKKIRLRHRVAHLLRRLRTPVFAELVEKGRPGYVDGGKAGHLYTGTWNGEWRKLEPGDLVELNHGPVLGQVESFNDDGVVVAMVYDFGDGTPYREGRTNVCDPESLRLLPDLPFALPGMIEAPPPPAKRPHAERAFGHELEELSKLVQEHLHPDNRVRWEIENLMENESYEYREKHPEKVERAVFGFYRHLSREEQIRVLNGWRPLSIRPAPGKLNPDMPNAAVRFYVPISASREGGTVYGEWSVEECWSATEVRIFAHSRKAEVLKELRDKMAWIDRNWDEIRMAKPWPEAA